MRNACKILGGKPEVKRLLRRPRHKLEINVKLDLKEMGCGSMTKIVWFKIGHSNESSGSIKGSEFPDWLSDYQLLEKDSLPWS
jgi:hypothetical protein